MSGPNTNSPGPLLAPGSSRSFVTSGGENEDGTGTGDAVASEDIRTTRMLNVDPATISNPPAQHTAAGASPSQHQALRSPSSSSNRLHTCETPAPNAAPPPQAAATPPSKALTQLYTIAHLIFFSLLGTLARLGLDALTAYPGAPVAFGVLWSNVGGSLVMGFLIEDGRLFRYEWGTSDRQLELLSLRKKDDGNNDGKDAEAGYDAFQKQIDLAAAKKAHLAVKKTIPLYVGLATGFCGSFTSFSSFIRDMFLAVSNSLVARGQPSAPARNGGYSFMAMLAVLITTVALSISALIVGGQLAAALERVTPSVSFHFSRRVFDPLIVVLSCGCWLGAVLMAVFPPHNAWRGQAVFSLVFAPLGCLLRFYLALYLNGRFATFPLGTFAANLFGTAVLGTAWDISHVPIGGIVGCQVLQGVEDGFCGCLTTVSTWVAELRTLRRRSAWLYGAVSVAASFLFLIGIMGGIRWSRGFHPLVCET
ncbi:Fluoride export protein 1 [Paramyrothecium foliicola]|nr:Fluoride export protein 1 [Paramyrothecium foliicola]